MLYGFFKHPRLSVFMPSIKEPVLTSPIEFDIISR